MNDYFSKVFTETSKFLKNQSPLKILAMAVVGTAITVGMAVMFFWAGETTFSPLMTNLNPEDAANIMRLLRDKKIPFKVDASGRNIMVPPESRDDLRLALATMGLPQTSVVGYELFDKQSLGTTSFVQKMNQKRALEGELMRTINSIRGVGRSRVHLALPQKSTFVEDQKKSTASVVVDLDPGVKLNEKQVDGIGHLVSSAVEGMESADVVIMDANGKVLSKNNSDPLARATATQLEFQTKLETDYENRIVSMLSRVVGDGRVEAKVTAELDFSQVNETQTVYDSDGAAIMSVERKNDTMSGVRPAPGGPGGAASNTPGQAPMVAAGGEIKNETNKSNETVNYQVPQTVRRTARPVGTVKKLSVAVMVDGKQVKEEKDGKVLTRMEPWSAEKLQEFSTLAASAVGIDRKRGDIMEIKQMEFSREDFDEASRVIAAKEQKTYIQNMVIYSVIGLAILMFFLFVVRPFIKWITENTIDNVDSFLPQTIEELEKMQKNTAIQSLEEVVPTLPERMDPEKVEGEMMKEKIISMIDANPHKAALILRDWLHAVAKKNLDEEVDGAKKDGKKGKSA